MFISENRGSHLSAGLIGLLVYQWLLVLIALGYSIAATLAVWDEPNPLIPLIALFILACWGIALGLASMGIMRRNPRRLPIDPPLRLLTT